MEKYGKIKSMDLKVDEDFCEVEVAVWEKVCVEAENNLKTDPLLSDLLDKVLNSKNIGQFLSLYLPPKLGLSVFHDVFSEYYSSFPELLSLATEDLKVNLERDPICSDYCYALLFSKGFHVLQCYRISHALWSNGKHYTAALLNNLVSEKMGVDIHPAARLGKGIFVDHATGFVVGETTVIGDRAWILHGVTLGSIGNEKGDRHPKIGKNVFIGAGAKILGPLTIGDHAKIGAGAVVIQDVPSLSTAVGVPAKII